MQHGCMERLNRKRGPEVWQFRWSVTGPEGKRLYHKKIVGTVERYPDENAARRSVVPESVVKTHGEFDFSPYFTWCSLRFWFLTEL